MTKETKDLLERVYVKAQKERDNIVMHRQRLYESYNGIVDCIKRLSEEPATLPFIEKYGLNKEYPKPQELFTSLEIEDLNSINDVQYKEEYAVFKDLCLRMKNCREDIDTTLRNELAALV